MASVTLEDAWFHLASDLSDSIRMDLTGESDDTARPVDVRRYAGGRVRAIVRPAAKKQLSLTFELADRADYDQLLAWAGETVMYRDTRGRKVFGVYGVVSGVELPGVGDDVLNVTLSFSEVSVSEEV